MYPHFKDFKIVLQLTHEFQFPQVFGNWSVQGIHPSRHTIPKEEICSP